MAQTTEQSTSRDCTAVRIGSHALQSTIVFFAKHQPIRMDCVLLRRRNRPAGAQYMLSTCKLDRMPCTSRRPAAENPTGPNLFHRGISAARAFITHRATDGNRVGIHDRQWYVHARKPPATDRQNRQRYFTIVIRKRRTCKQATLHLILQHIRIARARISNGRRRVRICVMNRRRTRPWFCHHYQDDVRVN